jgi:anhydro-N-acetylmuramic acid kinase
MLSIGLMSGTSMDGIDAALLETDGEDQLLELGHVKLNYAREVHWLLKAAERAVKNAKGDLTRANQFYIPALQHYLTDELQLSPLAIQTTFSHLSQQYALSLSGIIELSTRLHAEAIRKLLEKTPYQARDIDIIGYHGQTVLHNPAVQLTIQLGDGALLAQLTKIPVINHFRHADIAAGGQGAPFAPLYHQALAKRDGKIPLIVVNCGGIANISLICNTQIDSLIGFDTGPGNGLIDQLIKQRTHGVESMDKDGQYGRTGQINSSVLHQLVQHALPKKPGYFNAYPPKALDIRDLVLIPELESLSLPDACATLEYFTAKTIVDSLDLLKLATDQIPRHWILAGGGWYNPVIRDNLSMLLQQRLGTNVIIQTASEAGWNNDAVEAQIFAYFSVRSLKGLPLSVPGTTGVPKPLTGGVLHTPTDDKH